MAPPPSTRTVEPVAKGVVTRNSTAFAISSGWPTRRAGRRCAALANIASRLSLGMPDQSGVAIRPGELDVIGGNSGSPVVNAKGELVGVAFDANEALLAGRYVYNDQAARAISVDSRAILEGLRKIYNATALADELTGNTQ